MRRKRKRQRKRLKEDNKYSLSSYKNENEEESIKSKLIRRIKGKKSVIYSINPPRSPLARTKKSTNMIDSIFFAKQSIIILMFVTCIALIQISVSGSTLTDFDGKFDLMIPTNLLAPLN